MAFAGKLLPRKGVAPSFDALAQSIVRDVHPRTLLEQLVAAGTISVDGDVVTLIAESYQPLAGSADQIAYLARNGGDFLSAATDNIISDGDGHFERAAHYDGLSGDAVAHLDARFRKGQMALLQKISHEAARLQEKSPGSQRFRAGGYFYSPTKGDS